MTDEVARQWLAAMLGVSIQFTVLAAIAAVALLALPRLAPSIRHLVWLLVLLRLTVPVGLTSPFGALPPSLFQTQSTDAPSRNSRIGGGLAETSTVVAIPGTSPRTTSKERDGASTTPAAPTASPAVLMFLAWGAGVLVLASTQLLRAARRRARTRAATALPPEIERRIDALRREISTSPSKSTSATRWSCPGVLRRAP